MIRQQFPWKNPVGFKMGIHKVRMYECDTRNCTSVVFDAFNRMPEGWAWRHVAYRDGKYVKVVETHSYAMFLFCPICMDKENTDVPEL